MSNDVIKDAMRRIFSINEGADVEITPIEHISLEKRISEIKRVTTEAIDDIRAKISTLDASNAVRGNSGQVRMLDHVAGILRAIYEYVDNDDSMRGVTMAATLLTNSMGDVRDGVPNELWELLTVVPEGLPKLEIRIVENEVKQLAEYLEEFNLAIGDFDEDQVLMAKSHVVINEGSYNVDTFLKENSTLFDGYSDEVVKYLLESIAREKFKKDLPKISTYQIRNFL